MFVIYILDSDGKSVLLQGHRYHTWDEAIDALDAIYRASNIAGFPVLGSVQAE